MLRRLVMVTPDRIERVGMREFVDVDGEATPLLRLEQVLPVSAAGETNPLFLLLPKNLPRPLAIVATSIIDTESLPAELNRAAFQADGVVGSTMLRGRLTLLLDFSRLAERADSAGPPALTAGPDAGSGFWRSTTRSFFANWCAGISRRPATPWPRRPTERRPSANWMRPLRSGRVGHRNARHGWLGLGPRHPPASGRRRLAPACPDDAQQRRRPGPRQTCGFDGYEVKLDRQQFLTTVGELLSKPRVQP